MEFWGLVYLASIPTKHVPPPGIMYQSLDKKKEYFDTVVGEFIDNYVMSDPDLEEIGQYKEWQRQTREATNNDHGYAMTPTYDETEPDVDFPPEALPIDRENADRVRTINLSHNFKQHKYFPNSLDLYRSSKHLLYCVFQVV